MVDEEALEWPPWWREQNPPLVGVVTNVTVMKHVSDHGGFILPIYISSGKLPDWLQK